MPHLNDLWSEIAKTRKDVQFYAVNIGDEKDVIADYWKEGGFAFPPVRQKEGEVSKAFGVNAYPTNYVIGPDGKVLWRAVGFDPKALEEALAKTAKKKQ